MACPQLPQWQVLGPGSGSSALTLSLVLPGSTQRIPATQPLCSGQMPQPPASLHPSPPSDEASQLPGLSGAHGRVDTGGPRGPQGGGGSLTGPSAQLQLCMVLSMLGPG